MLSLTSESKTLLGLEGQEAFGHRQIVGAELALLALRESITKNQEQSPVDFANKGKKRAASWDDEIPPPKRARRYSDLTSLASDDVQIIEDDASSSLMCTFLVYHHRFIMSCEGYDPHPANSKANRKLKGVEKQLISTLQASSDGGVDLACTLEPTQRGYRMMYRVDPLHPPGILLYLPPLKDERKPSDHDFSNLTNSNLYESFQLLEEHGRLAVTVSTKAILRDETLCFQIDLQVSVNTPKIFEPVQASKGVARIQEAQRRVLSYVLRSRRPILSTPYKGITDVSFFHSCLRPAPASSSLHAEEAAQPEDLLPTLLPFQRRTVAWLLRREGKLIGSDGSISMGMGAQTKDPFLWDKLPFQDPDTGENWYFNSLTGVISPRLPNETVWPGGILAEEPGLGKTLESIALVLLNPAVGRSPLNRRFDPVSRLQVKEIKTTLIVTPSALAPQWVDEIAAHAPTLKVLVFKGWKETQGSMLIYDGYTNKPLTAAEHRKKEEERQRKKYEEFERRMTLQYYAASSIKGKGKQKATEDAMDPDEGDEQVDPDDWATYVNEFDVCIVTYDTLRKEIDVAKAPMTRPRREAAKLMYSSAPRPRSPLVMCEWYRVIMDEVQMVGGGKTEEMVSLVPRLSSFAVSGTPARASATDLIHVLNFLRVPSSMNSIVWKRLLKPGYAPYFADLFGRLSVRTMKASVQAELTIPPQTRYIVPISLGRVERHVYDQHVESALLELGLDARGVAASQGWDLNVSVLRTWVRRLRQMCTHPQVGQGLVQKGGNKLAKPGTLKTIEQVLQGMREQSWRTVMDDRKARVQGFIREAQLLQHKESDPQRYMAALDIMLKAQTEIGKVMADIRLIMREHDAKGELLKQEANQGQAEERRSQTEPNPTPNREPTTRQESSMNKGKGRAREPSSVPSIEDIDSVDDDLPHNPAGEEHRVKKRALQSRLRECYIVEHRVLFLLGDIYHVLGRAQPEENAYADADTIRKKILKTAERGALDAMSQLEQDLERKCVRDDELIIKPCDAKGGIKSQDLMEEANELIELINDETKLLFRWKEHLISLLIQPLTNTQNEDGNVDGNEYLRSLDTQGEAESYLQGVAAVMADRREVLLNERTALAAHDAREKKLRHTKAAMKAAAALDDPELLEVEEIDLQPEHEVLQKDLRDERKELHERYTGRAIKSVMTQLSNVANAIASDKDPEKVLAKERALLLRRLISSQGALNERLENDLAQLRKTFNERIHYFRRLQELSDTVAEVEWEGTIEDALNGCKVEQAELQRKLNTELARHRYVDNLAKSQADGTLDEDERSCILCKCDFVRGYITNCAHVFCEQCLREWLAKNGVHKSCPVCRVPIIADQLQRFSIRDQQPEKLPAAAPELVTDSAVPVSRRTIDYNVLDPQKFAAIETMESHGDYGSKIQTLVRHLIYLQQSDPGAKSIVFSAWADSLHIIGHALEHNGIPCLRIDQGGKTNPAKQFRDSPEILVLLLHGERENAGLNITCASRVFLLESVVRHSFEVQAIARIDRMGQKKPTEVYCYYAEDTVEKNILDLAARQGQSLYTKDKAQGTLDVASTMTLDNQTTGEVRNHGKDMKGDMIDKTDDLLATLFPHMFEDLEYLLPPEDGLVAQHRPPVHVQSRMANPLNNAVAGPSGLSRS